LFPVQSCHQGDERQEDLNGAEGNGGVEQDRQLQTAVEDQTSQAAAPQGVGQNPQGRMSGLHGQIYVPLVGLGRDLLRSALLGKGQGEADGGPGQGQDPRRQKPGLIPRQQQHGKAQQGKDQGDDAGSHLPAAFDSLHSAVLLTASFHSGGRPPSPQTWRSSR